ncbi:hypothetical protein C7N43_28690 [Sphingobacteriales bacterium UPWRP_1]|nr:hypothetical protein BVG80_13055 [Sphingobacteriales bacterium TSM_CSM]PSJ73514.1 hypothetical protein C7N43_28690 [Sphingobacteriales bacterium UPWRP_1]
MLRRGIFNLFRVNYCCYGSNLTDFFIVFFILKFHGRLAIWRVKLFHPLFFCFFEEIVMP